MKLLPLLALAAVLTGCGSSTTSDNAPKAEGAHYGIKSFTVVGSDGSTNPAAINPAIGGGVFVLNTEINDGRPLYTGEFFLSTNDTLSNADITLCTFDNSNIITCGDDVTTDISDFLTSLPMTAYIIFEACDITGLNCNNKAAKVVFQ